MEKINFSCGCCTLNARPGAGHVIAAKSAVGGARNTPIAPTNFQKQSPAEYAQKLNLVKIFNNGGNVHTSKTMQKMFGLSPLVVENRTVNDKR